MMLLFKFPCVPSRRHQGFTLVELMVALVLGLLVVIGATQLFLTTRQTFVTVEEVNRRQEVVSFITNVVAYEVRASTGVSPWEGQVKAVNSGNLVIQVSDGEYGGHCSSGDLQALEYFANEGSLFLAPKCSSTDPGAQPVIFGVEDISFTQGVVNGNEAYIDATVTLSDGAGTTLNFRFSRRSSDIFI
jgi:prepilin-type N-terminal cleavage/methylation domain-containing protein